MVDFYPLLQNAQPELFLKNEWSIYHPSLSFEFSIGLLGFYLDCRTKVLLLFWHYSTTLITIFCKSWLSIIITNDTCFCVFIFGKVHWRCNNTRRNSYYRISHNHDYCCYELANICYGWDISIANCC